MQAPWVLAPVLLSFGLPSFELRCLSGFCSSEFLFRLIQLRSGYEYRQLGEPILCCLVAGSDEDLRVEMGIVLVRDFT